MNNLAKVIVAAVVVALAAIVVGSVIAFPYLLAVYVGLPLVAVIVVWALRRVP